MDIALTIALIGASVSVVGWVATHLLQTSAERRRQRLIFQMEYTKQQLEELYGPLAFLVWEGDQSHHVMRSFLHPSFFDLLQEKAGNIPSEEDLKAWLYWVENEFLPHDKKIQELLSKKTHLVEGGTLPESFLAFVNYYNAWRVNHERWQKQGVEYGWLSKLKWPAEFNEEVLSTFKTLKKRHATLIGMIAENENLLRTFQRQFHRENHKPEFKADEGGP